MKVFFVGGASQARLCYNILRKEGHEVPAVYDATEGLTVPWGAPVFHDEGAIPEQARACEGFLVCIGDIHGYIRTRYSNQLRALGLMPVAAIHPTAYFGDNVTLGAGLQAISRSVVTDDAVIGDYAILNTSCSVDHQCRLGIGVHVMGSGADRTRQSRRLLHHRQQCHGSAPPQHRLELHRGRRRRGNQERTRQHGGGGNTREGN